MSLERIEGDIQYDLAGDTAQRQQAGHPCMPVVDRLHMGGQETRIRIPLAVEQVARQCGVVPLAVAQVQPRHRNADIQPCVLPVRGIEVQDTFAARYRPQRA